METNWLLSNGLDIGDILDDQIKEVDTLHHRYKSLKSRFNNRQRAFKKIVRRTRGEEFFKKIISTIEDIEKRRDPILIIEEERIISNA